MPPHDVPGTSQEQEKAAPRRLGDAGRLSIYTAETLLCRRHVHLARAGQW